MGGQRYDSMDGGGRIAPGAAIENNAGAIIKGNAGVVTERGRAQFYSLMIALVLPWLVIFIASYLLLVEFV